MKPFSPQASLDELKVSGGYVHVVRDDLLAGGTKQRALVPYLQELSEHSWDEFVYASPFCGFAQVALAVCCHELDLKCTIFAEADPQRASSTFRQHEFTALASSYGAQVYLNENLNDAELSANRYSIELSSACFKIPLGLNAQEYKKHLAAELAHQWNLICEDLGRVPRKLWLPVGSGTLARIFRSILPEQVILNCVDVHVLPDSDERIRSVRALPNTYYYPAAESFSNPASVPPPVPSNQFYDAKLWSFIDRYADDGDLWWNVAR